MKKTAHLINKNKISISKIALSIGAIAVVLTSIMGLAGCTPSKEEHLTYKEYQAAFEEMARTEVPDLNISDLTHWGLMFDYHDNSRTSSGTMYYFDTETEMLLAFMVVLPADSRETFEAWKESYKEQFSHDSFYSNNNNSFYVKFENLNNHQRAEAVKLFYDLSLDPENETGIFYSKFDLDIFP